MARPEHRLPPLPECFTSGHTPRGRCRWCGEWIKGENGRTNFRKRWHEDCLDRYYFLTRPNVTASWVWDRDEGRCADCGIVRYRAHHYPFYPNGDAWVRNRTYATEERPEEFVGPWCDCRFEVDWAVDHRVPLWKSEGLDDAARLLFFELDNLQTLCGECHKRKTAREAAERAKWRRQVRKAARRTAPQEPLPEWL